MPLYRYIEVVQETREWYVDLPVGQAPTQQAITDQAYAGRDYNVKTGEVLGYTLFDDQNNPLEFAPEPEP